MAVDTPKAKLLQLVTIDNYQEVLPKWTGRDGSLQLFAIVDMGSNGIRFTISDLTMPTTRLLKTIYKERAAISLYDALNSSGTTCLTFPAETIALVAKTIARFKHIATLYSVPCENFTVLATEAMRAAGNATDMLTAIDTAASVGVNVLEPAVETLFGAVMGSRASFSNIHSGGLLLDLGGGSVQMSWLDTRDPDYALKAAITGKSLPFGAARLSRILDKDVTKASVRATELQTLRSGFKDAFARLCREFPALQDLHSGSTKGINVYMCGGGFRGYGSMLMHYDDTTPYPVPSIANYVVDGDLFRKTKRMKHLAATYEGNIFGVSKRRRKQFPAIVEVVEALINAVDNIRTVTFCTGSNREGSLMMKLPVEIRERNPVDSLMFLTPQCDKVESADNHLSVVKTAAQVLSGAIPGGEETLEDGANIFGMSLQHFFVSQIWDYLGGEEAGNATRALHEATLANPGIPGLCHVARAVMAVTMTARWGSKVGPCDDKVLEALRKLLQSVDPQAVFWAEYLGAVAGAMARLVPFWPRTMEDITHSIKLEAEFQGKNLGDGLKLTIYSTQEANIGLDLEDIKSSIKDARKSIGKKACGKIEVAFENLERA